jgi:hypothetical protein
MTLEEFLVKLRETPRNWLVTAGDDIRTVGGMCPLEVVADVPKFAFEIAALELSIDRKLRSRIVMAADTEHREPEVRAKLLEACGL